MSTEVAGKINQYIELVGQSGETVKAEVQRIIDKLGCTPVIREVDKEFLGYGSSKSFWLLHDAGVEFHWENDMLTAVALHTQPSESSVSEYRPYTDSLFVNFSNTDTRDKIILHLGTPPREGEWKRSWICYDNPNNTWTNFEFDNTLHLRAVMVCMPIG